MFRFFDQHAAPTPQHQANLARIRDNQRRSRARKREYLQELEQRLRLYELHGIEAPTEVQLAARRVADENRHLRDLLAKHGISDDYISSYLQAVMATAATTVDPHNPQLAPAAPGPPGGGGLGAQAAGSSQPVQSLQQQLKPRRLDTGTAPFALSVQTSPQDSIASVSTTASSLWEAQHGIPTGGPYDPNRDHQSHIHQQQQQQQPPQPTTTMLTNPFTINQPAAAAPGGPPQQQQQHMNPFTGMPPQQQHGRPLVDTQSRQQGFQGHLAQTDVSRASVGYPPFPHNPRDYAGPGGYS